MPQAIVCTVCGAELVLRRETFDKQAGVYVGDLKCPDCGRRYLDQRQRSHPRKAAVMAKRGRDGYPKANDKPKRGRPRQQDLIEDRAIKPLEDAAEDYAEVRDERMELTKKETSSKRELLALMKKHGKEKYHRGPITVKVIVQKETVQVRIRKNVEAEPAGEDVNTEAPATDESESAEVH